MNVHYRAARILDAVFDHAEEHKGLVRTILQKTVEDILLAHDARQSWERPAPYPKEEPAVGFIDSAWLEKDPSKTDMKFCGFPLRLVASVDVAELERVVNFGDRSRLTSAFDWRSTLEGYDHWAAISHGMAPFSYRDRDYAAKLLQARNRLDCLRATPGGSLHQFRIEDGPLRNLTDEKDKG